MNPEDELNIDTLSNTHRTAIDPKRQEILRDIKQGQEKPGERNEVVDDLAGNYEDAILVLTDFDAYDALGALTKEQELYRERVKESFQQKFGTPYKSTIKTIEDADKYFQRKLGMSLHDELVAAGRLVSESSLEAMKARAKELEDMQGQKGEQTAEKIIERFERNIPATEGLDTDANGKIIVNEKIWSQN